MFRACLLDPFPDTGRTNEDRQGAVNVASSMMSACCCCATVRVFRIVTSPLCMPRVQTCALTLDSAASLADITTRPQMLSMTSIVRSSKPG